tara:strand:- start:31 stop:633 length:603 start_codon:yes stop_codon:yes gene_type:complete
MILSNENEPCIDLEWFGLKREDSDVREKYRNWLNDPLITDSLASPDLNKANKNQDFIEESFNRFTQVNCIGFFIRYIPDNIYIGTAKVDNISFHNKSAWDGIMIGDRSYHGRGLASIVYKLLLAYAFSELNLLRISGGCNSNNIPMIKTFKRLGYMQEGRLRNADLINDKYSDHLYFGILKNEFFAKNKVNLIVNKEKKS